MTAGSWQRLAPAEPAGALFMLFLTFPGVFLPIDLIYAAGGILTYATPDQAARIFLYLAALSVVASLGCCALGATLGTFATRWLCFALIAFALGHGLLIWSSYFVHYLPELRWLRQLALAALSLATAFVVAKRRPPQMLSAVSSVLRASALLMAFGVLAALVVVAVASRQDDGTPTAAQPALERPPIILITMDTLSALHLPMYGYRRPTAPRLTEFAGGATVFLRNYASSNFTTGSVTSLLFGHRPWAHRVIQLEGRPSARLHPESLPALLRDAGYFTASVSTNPWASPRHLRIAGHFSAMSEHRICVSSNPVYALDPDLQTAVQSSLVWNELAWLVMHATDRLGTCERGHFDPELVFSAARRILAGAPAGAPVFLWLHLFSPHAPYVTPQPFLGMFDPGPKGRDRISTIPPNLFEAGYVADFPGVLRDRYDESVRHVDHHLGMFLDELRRQGRYDDALIVITADHGESFSKGYGSHGGPLLHEELVRVPLLLKAPGQRARTEVPGPSELVDLKPTILELAGIRTEHRGEGISLVPAIEGKSLDRPVFSMNFQQSGRAGPLETGTVAMIHGRWKYVRYIGAIRYPFMPALEDALYDLEADPGETRNLIAARPEVASRMREEIEARLRQHGKRIE